MHIAVAYTSTVGVMASALAHNVSESWGEGGMPRKIGWGLLPASQNPYPIYEQNLPYL